LSGAALQVLKDGKVIRTEGLGGVKKIPAIGLQMGSGVWGEASALIGDKKEKRGLTWENGQGRGGFG